ncbi:MAG TPA: DNA ligase D, partial [Gammaproteobacteria bacterium]
YRKGRLHFVLHGEKLRGRWTLVRMRKDDDQWLLIKGHDEHAGDKDILRSAPGSVLAGAPDVAADRSAARTDAADSAPARRGHPPAHFTPQLATLSRTVPAGDDWLHESKYDGYRVLAVRRNGKLRLLSRNGLDWTGRLPGIADACARLPAEEFVLDGELVVRNAQGISDFQALQTALHERDDKSLVYFVFDLPYAEGFDLRRQNLLERKRRLTRLLEGSAPVLHYSDHVVGRGEAFLEQACAHGLEGIVSKRCAAPYASRRSTDWLKIKCSQRQEFVIGGYTDPGGARSGFGALLLGYWQGDALHYAGRVGTGFDERLLKQLSARLRKLETAQPAYADPPTGREARGVHWCRPELVGEVEFTGWTRDGRLRHPAFQGLREDKPARAVVREDAAQETDGARKKTPRKSSTRTRGEPPESRGKERRETSMDASEASIAGVTITHPGRVLYPSQGVTKRELAEYYVQVADWILPGVTDRPLTLVRCPRGRQQQCFYQKHLTGTLPEPVEGIEIEEQDGHATYIVIRDLRGLITLVQFGALELHPWPARADRQDRPDRLVFDLDPGEGVDVKRLIAAARELRDTLDELGLQSFVRTTGGKGLHVVVPLERRHDWRQLREFAEALARLLALRSPKEYVASMRKSQRAGRIFIDYLRNSRGATSIASYSSRARSGAPVATPLRWDELGRLRAADQFTIRTVPRRLAGLREDPWEGFGQLRQRLPKI